jgi:hypothetical protein
MVVPFGFYVWMVTRKPAVITHSCRLTLPIADDDDAIIREQDTKQDTTVRKILSANQDSFSQWVFNFSLGLRRFW